MGTTSGAAGEYKIPATVTVDSGTIIDLLATVMALGDASSSALAHALTGEAIAADTPFDELAGHVVSTTQDAIFGPVSQHDPEGGDRSPVEVAVYVRAAEIEAKLLEDHLRSELETHPLAERASCVRLHGQLIAEQGTIDVPFPEGRT